MAWGMSLRQAIREFDPRRLRAPWEEPSTASAAAQRELRTEADLAASRGDTAPDYVASHNGNDSGKDAGQGLPLASEALRKKPTGRPSHNSAANKECNERPINET